MKSEHAREFCIMESSANEKWQQMVDMAEADQVAWIKELETAHHMLCTLGLKYAAHLLVAADIKLTAELFRMATTTGDDFDEIEQNDQS